MLTANLNDPKNASSSSKTKEASTRAEAGIHPLLADVGEAGPTAPTRTSNKDRYKPMQPKFTTTQVCIPSPFAPVGVLIILELTQRVVVV
jgi:hypothetical protein